MGLWEELIVAYQHTMQYIVLLMNDVYSDSCSVIVCTRMMSQRTNVSLASSDVRTVTTTGWVPTLGRDTHRSAKDVEKKLNPMNSVGCSTRGMTMITKSHIYKSSVQNARNWVITVGIIFHPSWLTLVLWAMVREGPSRLTPVLWTMVQEGPTPGLQTRSAQLYRRQS